MIMQRNDALLLWVLIGVAGVMLLGTSGIAAVLAWMPTPSTLPAAVIIPETPQAPPATVKCAECGVVEGTREIERPGEGTAPGAARASTRGDRSEITGDSTRTYEVTVRMNDGSSHVFMDAKRANWRPGARVLIIGGASQSPQ